MPRLAPPGGAADPAGVVGADRLVEADQGDAHPLAELLDELGGVEGLAQGGVMDLPVALEVGGQVGLGVPPAVGAHHPDLPAAQPVAKCPENAQLVGDALGPAPFVDHGGLPVGRHHPGQGHGLAGGVVADGSRSLRVAPEQVQCLHDWLVGRVVGAELERAQQPGHHPAVVAGVRRAQRLADPGLEHALVGLGLLDQVAQRGLAHHRVERPADRLVGVLDGRLGHAEQDALLAPDPAQVGQQLALHPVLGSGADLVHDADEQLHQAVGDLTGAGPAQGGQQGQAHLPRPLPQVGGVLLGGPGPPGAYHGVGCVSEQVSGQAQGPYALQLVDLGEQAVQADPARIGPEFPQHATAASTYLAFLAAVGHKLLQTVGRLGGEPGGGGGTEPVAGRRAGGADDPLDPPRWLDVLRPAAGQEGLSQSVLGNLVRGHLFAQPRGQGLLVGSGGLPEAESLTDLGPVVLDRPP